VAIALDGGLPESGPGGLVGQFRRSAQAGRAERVSTTPTLTNAYGALNSQYNDTRFSDPIAGTESPPDRQAAAAPAVAAAEFDPGLVKESFAHLMSAGPEAMEYFYARLFADHPDSRALFPMAMSAQRERMFAALTRLIWSLDTEPGCAELLRQLGVEHRKFGVTERHYSAFFAALLATARHFIGADWRPETEAAWQGALASVSAAMRAAASAEAALSPPWWIAEIVEHELRSPGLAVLKLAPGQPLPYQAGQYVHVQVTRWPRVWRPFSIANSPRPSGVIELHVRAVPGGLVSNSLVYHCTVGDTVLLGPASGTMTLADSGRDLLCVAGGTGLAPIKAIIEQVIARSVASNRRKITLFLGARQQFDLYDLQDLRLLEAAYPSLQVIPVLSDQPGFAGSTGLLPDVLHAHGISMFSGAEAYICGPAAMVGQAAALLAASIPAAQIHHDPLAC
jgi:NAD(P)H-flavin reductase/hemoglobin-like flavoprotein